MPSGVESLRAFFDVRIFNPFSPSNRKPLLSSVYRQHEKVKKRHYEQRIQDIEHSSFTPLVLSSTGGMGPITTVFLQTVGIATSCKVGGTLFYDHGLAPLQVFIFPLTCSIMCIEGPALPFTTMKDSH